MKSKDDLNEKGPVAITENGSGTDLVLDLKEAR